MGWANTGPALTRSESKDPIYASDRRKLQLRSLLLVDVSWKSVNPAVPYAHVVAGKTAAAVDRLPEIVQNPCNSEVTGRKDRRTRKKFGLTWRLGEGRS